MVLPVAAVPRQTWLCSSSLLRINVVGTTGGASPGNRLAARGAVERLHDQLAHPLVLDVADRRDDQVRRRGRPVEVPAQPPAVNASTSPSCRGSGRPSGWSSQKLGEQLVDEVVGRVLDHLDLFEDDLLLALDVLGR